MAARSRRGGKKKTSRLFEPRRYTRETVYRDREYGMFWYAWLWQLLRPVLIFACSLLIVVGIASTAWNKLYNGYIAATEPGNKETPGFTIASGESVSRIGENLEKQNYIRSARLFKYYVQFYGLTNELQSGVYYLSRDMNLFDVVTQLSSGKGVSERTIRIIPGWTCEDIADYLVTVGAIDSRDDFLTACKNYQNYQAYSIALINAGENADLTKRTYPLEGYLAPDTYRVYLSADADSIIRTLLTQTDSVYQTLFDNDATYDENGNMITEAGKNGTDSVTLTDDEIFILASIIEKEASTLDDMKKVSAVFYNRLAAGIKLQSDPTATYLTGVKRLALTEKDTSVDTAYNTYRISGLPVGPICNPSKNALTAALHPDETFLAQNYLFFCAAEPGTGKLAFAQTYDEHASNVATYRPLWEAYDREQGNN